VSQLILLREGLIQKCSCYCSWVWDDYYSLWLRKHMNKEWGSTSHWSRLTQSPCLYVNLLCTTITAVSPHLYERCPCWLRCLGKDNKNKYPFPLFKHLFFSPLDNISAPCTNSNHFCWSLWLPPKTCTTHKLPAILPSKFGCLIQVSSCSHKQLTVRSILRFIVPYKGWLADYENLHVYKFNWEIYFIRYFPIYYYQQES